MTRHVQMDVDVRRIVLPVMHRILFAIFVMIKNAQSVLTMPRDLAMLQNVIKPHLQQRLQENVHARAQVYVTT